MHQVILRSAEMIQAGDITGAERALVAVADQAGDHALVAILDDMQPKDLLAVMREFDSSRESIVNMLVTSEQFASELMDALRQPQASPPENQAKMSQDELNDWLKLFGG